LQNTKGVIWQDETYNRIIRDEQEYSDKMNYIIYNPLRAGVVEKIEDYRWLFVQENA
jgi:hypothetical protein